MKKIYIVFLLVWTTVVGCHRVDPTLDNEQGKAVTLQWNIVQSPIVQTKASQQTAAETLVDNLWVFAFAEDKLVQACQSELIDNSASKAHVKLDPSSTTLDIFVVANAASEQEAIFKGFVVGATTVADLKALETQLVALTGQSGLPMWGQALGQTIDESTASISLALTRSCAKIDIVVTNTVADFTLGGVVKLLHANKGATLFPSANTPATATAISDVVPTDLNLSSIYLYEKRVSATAEQALESDAVAVVIKGTYKGIEGYYKLRLRYTSGADVAHNVNRNTAYSFQITAVQAPGFVSLAEAEANYPQNVQYSVSSTDGNEYDLTVSNGQYALGVTNSEYVLYASGAQTGVDIATWTHQAPAGATLSDGTITASAGITLSASSTTIPVAANGAGFKTGTIVADLDAAFTTGSITLRLGNLIKVITVSRKDELMWVSHVCTDFNQSEYVVSEVTKGYSWLKLGSDAKSYTEDRQLTSSSTGGIWLHVVNPPQTTTERGTVFLSRTDGKGRVKAEIALNYPKFNSHDGWAGSNIYWSGSKLTFDNYEVNLNERYMGVYFQWGSLVALSTMWSDWDAKVILFAPGTMDQNGDPWTAAIGGTGYDKIPIPVITQTEVNSNIQVQMLRHNLLEAHNPERNIGDICKWMTDKGWAPATPNGKGWRMPTMIEFNLQGLKSGQKCAFEGNFALSLSSSPGGLTNVASGVRTVAPYAGVFFPAAGQSSYNNLNQAYATADQGKLGQYWSASGSTNVLYRYGVLINKTNVQSYPGNDASPTMAKAVRCVRVK